jgi:hypothetical protein
VESLEVRNPNPGYQPHPNGEKNEQALRGSSEHVEMIYPASWQWSKPMNGARWLFVTGTAAAITAVSLLPERGESACGMRWRSMPIITDNNQPAPKPDMSQPSQIAFITWDPEKKLESFAVQPRFEGNVGDFGMLIPTPSKPTIDELPRDFFKELAVFTTPVQRVLPASRLLLERDAGNLGNGLLFRKGRDAAEAQAAPGAREGGSAVPPRKTTVEVLGVGQVGAFNYKILAAGRADDLHNWLKDNKYDSGDEAVLDFYIKKQWVFTVMKIDTNQMKKNHDGSFIGDIAPMRFSFQSDKLVYPLKITQDSIKDATEALFYVLAPKKLDMTEFSWKPDFAGQVIEARQRFGKAPVAEKPLPNERIPAQKIQTFPEHLAGWDKAADHVRKEAKELAQGQTLTRLEWAKKLTRDDIKILTGDAPYSEKVPDPDEGFTRADVQKDGVAVYRVIERRLAKMMADRPKGYAVREAPAEDVKNLKLLAGHLQEGWFLTKMRKKFTKDEMNDDVEFTTARLNDEDDASDFTELLQPAQPTLKLEWGLDQGGGEFDRWGPLEPPLHRKWNAIPR